MKYEGEHFNNTFKPALLKFKQRNRLTAQQIADDTGINVSSVRAHTRPGGDSTLPNGEDLKAYLFTYGPELLRYWMMEQSSIVVPHDCNLSASLHINTLTSDYMRHVSEVVEDQRVTRCEIPGMKERGLIVGPAITEFSMRLQ